MLERIPLGPEAIAHIRWSLSSSGRTLSTLLQALPLESGRAFTFAPSGTDRAPLARFREGVLGSIEAYAGIASFVMAYLERTSTRYFVLEDVLVESGDPWLQSMPGNYVRYGLEVYHFVSGGDVSEDAVLQAIDNAKGYVTNAILTGGMSGPVLQRGDDVSEQQLMALCTSTDYIVVEAYDGEGFVIWSRA